MKHTRGVSSIPIPSRKLFLMTSCSCCRTELEPANPLLIEANAWPRDLLARSLLLLPGGFQDRAVSPGTRLRILLRARQFLFSPRSIRPHETASIPLPRSVLRCSVTRSVLFYLFSPRSDPLIDTIFYFLPFFFFFNFSTERLIVEEHRPSKQNESY